ncbi:MAG: OmdA domain containing protein [Corynebacteriales bacterium]|nr:OmdA domain containing protein [Mycobacteriales bacterium]
MPQAPFMFSNAAEWESWLAANHSSAPEIWLKIAKKGSGATSVTLADALDTALCYGWIDSHRKALDDSFYLQRYSPRSPKGFWSKVNVAKAEALIAAGRMRPSGLAAIDAARRDGRWDGAYEAQSAVTVPDDLRAALEDNPSAQAAFDQLGKTDRYLLILRLLKARTSAARVAALRSVLTRLADG